MQPFLSPVSRVPYFLLPNEGLAPLAMDMSPTDVGYKFRSPTARKLIAKFQFIEQFARKRANRNSARASRSKFCRANRNWLQSSHRNYRRNGGRVSNRQPEAAEFKLCCRLKGGQQFRQPVRLISTARQGRFRSARAEFRLRSPDRTHRQIPIYRAEGRLLPRCCRYFHCLQNLWERVLSTS